MPRASKVAKASEHRRFHLFERCTGGFLNSKFDSDLLESFYSECSFPRATGRFRFGTVFIAFACVIWLLYFCILQLSQWEYYLYGLICGVVLSAGFFGVSYAGAFFKTNFLWISGLYASVFSLLALLPFAIKFPSVTLAFNLSISVQLVVLIYTMIPLRLWQLLLICGPLSLVQIILAGTRYGSIGAANVFLHVVAHIFVHIIGVILHLMSQVWRRSTFLRLGYSALMRKELKKEKELRDDMIRSLMPNEVAQEVMRDVGQDGSPDDPDGEAGDSKRGSAQKKKRLSKKNSAANDQNMDELAVGVLGFSDDFDEDEDDEELEPSKKLSSVSNAEPNIEAGEGPADLEVTSSSPRASLVPKGGGARTVAFRKFHVSQLENVSVLFADIVGFTKMSSNKSASHLVYLLNDLFGRFDRLCEMTGCEKIATLGDCYYCVAGCPNPVSDHAERAVEMGRAMCLAIQQFDEDHKEEVNMRVGVHTGKVICGLVGTRRFKFDVWSNDVTLANEMESTGQPGKVHISEATLGFVKDIYLVSEGEAVQDIRKFKVLVEFFNKEEQCFAIKHTQDEAKIKTYFIEERLDGKPVSELPRVNIDGTQTNLPSSVDNTAIPETEISAHPLIRNATSNVETAKTDVVNGENTLSTAVTTALNEHRLSVDQKQASLKPPIGRGSDVEMLQALQGLAKVEDVFAFPPISRFTLNFRVRTVELCYRRLGIGRPKGHAIYKLSWSTPRIAPLVNGTMEFLLLTTILITCFFVFPDSRVAAISGAFYAVAAIAFLIHVLFMTLLFTDLVAWACRPTRGAQTRARRTSNWRRCAIKAYRICFHWPLRNAIGAVLLVLPTAVVLSNFNGTFFWKTEFYAASFVAHYRLLFGLFFTFMLFNVTLFISFSFWTKLLSASLGCFCAIILLILPAQYFTDRLDVYVRVWQDVPVAQDQTDSFSWTTPVLHSNFRWEFGVILGLTLILISALNREFDISFRLSFHRDYEALEAKLAIAQQKVQADWLLENIIPYYIMDDLRRTNKYSRHIEDAGVVFATISNFSEFYDEQYQGGQEMLRVLNEIFADFEHQLALNKYKDVEKIKTIGACFMAASGLNMTERANNRNPNAHLYALMDFSSDLIRTLDDFNRQMFNFQFELKVGYNIGEVTAGVIGTTKLLYDIWGDTVNVASRMYSTGQKGRIQVTEAVAKRLESRYVFEYRGDVFVKGKGDMKTYLLAHRRND
ncbi:hypothetical protein P879_00741 [Paragonimus westermani]|uniref:adenylate cyclase n=1 Tax=Paragonimus westermani TaxID=34504 RepID=A0A8T0DXP2_9TREM|nr:hypothetical protein P879_00741 [Paragonimus westermani]